MCEKSVFLCVRRVSSSELRAKGWSAQLLCLRDLPAPGLGHEQELVLRDAGHTSYELLIDPGSV